TDAPGSTDINGGNVTTSGNQTYNDAVLLTADAVLNGENVTLASTLDGAHNLAVNSGGVTTFNGAVGHTTALTSLTTDAPGSTDINGDRKSVVEGKTENHAVRLTADAVLNGGNGTFASTLDGDQNLGVNRGGAHSVHG